MSSIPPPVCASEAVGRSRGGRALSSGVAAQGRGRTARGRRLRPALTLYLSESDVESLLSPADAVEAVEGSLLRMGQGSVELAPRRRLRLAHGMLADMAAADNELGYAGGKMYAATRNGARFAVLLFSAEDGE